MAININGLNGTPVQSTQQSPAQAENQSTRNATQPAQQANQSDTASLSDAARQLSQLESRLKSSPIVDINRVNNVQRAIETGTLEVNPGSIAEKLVQFESQIPA